MAQVNPLLSAFPLFRSTDREQVRAEVSRVFCPHELEPLDTRQPLSTVHNLVKLGETALNYLTYGSDVMILPGSLDRFYLIQLPLTGSAQVTSGKESIESNP